MSLSHRLLLVNYRMKTDWLMVPFVSRSGGKMTSGQVQRDREKMETQKVWKYPRNSCYTCSNNKPKHYTIHLILPLESHCCAGHWSPIQPAGPKLYIVGYMSNMNNKYSAFFQNWKKIMERLEWIMQTSIYQCYNFLVLQYFYIYIFKKPSLEFCSVVLSLLK